MTDMAVDAAAWLDRFAERLGVSPPTPEQQDALLALAGIAAHASERTAAPLSCWMVAAANLDPGEARGAAQRLANEFEREGESDSA
jgi:Domain of unknown function (DUF6457)